MIVVSVLTPRKYPATTNAGGLPTLRPYGRRKAPMAGMSRKLVVLLRVVDVSLSRYPPTRAKKGGAPLLALPGEFSGPVGRVAQQRPRSRVKLLALGRPFRE